MEIDPITNTLYSTELPTVSSDANTITCKLGTHGFLYRESVKSSVLIESAVFSLLLDGSRYASASSDDFRILAKWILPSTPKFYSGTATTSQASWSKTGLPSFSTVSCEAIAYQDHAIALSTSRAS